MTKVSLTADAQDIRYAYRLLLGREPDADGLEHHRKAAAEHGLTPREIAEAFLHSQEYAAGSRAEPVEVRMDGYSVFVRPNDHDIGQHVIAAHTYEPHVTRMLRELLRPGQVFVDVGANIGYFTNLAAQLVGPTGVVVAVEPMDKNLQLIYRAIARNGFRNVQVFACAVAERREIVRVATGPGTSNGQVIGLADDANATLYTQACRLDDLLGACDRVDVVKFDIEGFELRAWRGFERVLQRCRPAVLTEFHPHCMQTHAHTDPADYLRTLLGYGRISVLPHHGSTIGCRDAADVMRHWHESDQQFRGDGTHHLDLMIQASH